MRALIDTCIIIDALQKRKDFYKDAESIFLLCANCRFIGLLTAKSFTDIYYLTHKQTHDDKTTRTILMKLCDLFDILDTTKIDVTNAIFSDVSDFEDAVMIENGLHFNVDCIVTRNTNDFSKSKIPVYAPTKFIELFANQNK